jgi:hypothetical protein
VWADRQTPGVELDLNFVAPEGLQRAIAIIADVRPLLFSNGLVHLRGKSANDMGVLRKWLPPKEISEWPGEPIESVTDDPKMRK